MVVKNSILQSRRIGVDINVLTNSDPARQLIAVLCSCKSNFARGSICMIDLEHQADSGPYGYGSNHMLELYDSDNLEIIAS
jgi:hypothetical protein